MRIAHLSDPHLLDLRGVSPLSLLRGKRATGLANLALGRRRSHHASIARRLAKHVRGRQVDHVIITGDLTNLALEVEFRRAAAWLRDDLGFSPSRVSVVPGNHDRYTVGAVASGAFERTFGLYLQSDDSMGSRGTFPFVRLRGAAVIIGVDSGLPSPPFVAAGSVGRRQMEDLRALFDWEEVRRRTPIVVLHHPPKWTRSWVRERLHGLRDAATLQTVLPDRFGIVLHGHMHETSVASLQVGGSSWVVVGAPSASSTSARHERAAGYNLIEMDDAGVGKRVTSMTLSSDGEWAQRVLWESEAPRTAETRAMLQ